MPDSTIIGAILSNAGVGCAIMMVLILTGMLDTSRTVKRVEDEATRWHDAWEQAQGDVVALRSALAGQVERANASVDAAERLTGIIERWPGR